MNRYKKHKSLPDGAELEQILKFQFSRGKTSAIKSQLNFSFKIYTIYSSKKHDLKNMKNLKNGYSHFSSYCHRKNVTFDINPFLVQ